VELWRILVVLGQPQDNKYMTNQKKITRREAIKILGATAGASLLANLPSKWSTPELIGGYIPAHAQTSNCPVGTSSMVVTITGNSPNILIGTNGTFSILGEFPTGRQYIFGCQDVCFGLAITSYGDFPFTVLAVLDGVQIYSNTFPTTNFVSINVDGSTGAFGINSSPPGCNT